MLVKDGRYRDVYIPEDLYQELRESDLERERIQDQLIALGNQINRWLDIRFPEFSGVFKDWRGRTAWATLRAFPTPSKVAEAGIDGIMVIWKSQLKRPSPKKAEKLLKAAVESVGRTAGSEAAEVALQNMLSQYEMIQQQQEALGGLMQELLLRVPNAAKLLQIKGMGMLTAAIIVREIGDIGRFWDPRQILKMAGLSLREGLFRVMIPILANNAEFRQLHQRNLTRKNNPLSKMQSIIALCGKLIRVIYAILTKGCEYDAIKMLNDINRSAKAA